METLRFELSFLREEGLEWAYIGQAYENCSVWKSKLSKLEWWDGNKWNKNKNKELKELCLMDSTMFGTNGAN